MAHAQQPQQQTETEEKKKSGGRGPLILGLILIVFAIVLGYIILKSMRLI